MPTREEALAHIGTTSQLRAIQIRDTSRLRVIPADSGLAMRPRGRQAYRIPEEHLPAVLHAARMPQVLAETISTATTARVLTEALSREGRLTVLATDDEVVDVAPPGRYHPIDPERVFRMVERAVPRFEIQTVRDLPQHTYRLEMLGINERPVARGDLLRAGVLMQFSPLGITNPLVQAFASRLVCTNGMVSTEVLREFNFGRSGPGEGDDVYQFLRASAHDAYQAIGRIVERCRQMAQERIPAEDRAMILEAMIREAGLGTRAASAIRAAAVEQPPQTTYDALNLLTAATTHVETDTRRVLRAQRASAAFMDATQHARICPTCHRQQ